MKFAGFYPSPTRRNPFVTEALVVICSWSVCVITKIGEVALHALQSNIGSLLVDSRPGMTINNKKMTQDKGENERRGTYINCSPNSGHIRHLHSVVQACVSYNFKDVFT